MATRLTTGLFPRAMITSSPESAASISFDSVVLATWTVTCCLRPFLALS
jgi:hypothetical protein